MGEGLWNDACSTSGYSVLSGSQYDTDCMADLLEAWLTFCPTSSRNDWDSDDWDKVTDQLTDYYGFVVTSYTNGDGDTAINVADSNCVYDATNDFTQYTWDWSA